MPQNLGPSSSMSAELRWSTWSTLRQASAPVSSDRSEWRGAEPFATNGSSHSQWWLHCRRSRSLRPEAEAESHINPLASLVESNNYSKSQENPMFSRVRCSFVRVKPPYFIVFSAETQHCFLFYSWIGLFLVSNHKVFHLKPPRLFLKSQNLTQKPIKTPAFCFPKPPPSPIAMCVPPFFPIESTRSLCFSPRFSRLCQDQVLQQPQRVWPLQGLAAATDGGATGQAVHLRDQLVWES